MNLKLKLAAFCWLLTVAISCSLVRAQSIEPGSFGPELRKKLRTQFSSDNIRSYREARKFMFGTIDNTGGNVRLVYSGSLFPTTGIPDHRNVNTEHTWPQSKFKNASNRRLMKSDLHHLFPTWNRVNAARGSSPFGDIPDVSTEAWWKNKVPQATIPASSDIDGFSESTDSVFEPREDHKGNVARAMFYFYTMYEEKGINTGWFLPQVTTLLAWHLQDPVDQVEKDRNVLIETIQGNANPFVLDATLAARIFSTGPTDGSPFALARRTPRDGRDASDFSRILSDGTDGTSSTSELELHFLDVGQGDSTLILCPNGLSVLVDCGSLSSSSSISNRARDYLIDKLPAKEIDVVVITHPDTDHYRFLPDVLEGFQVGKLLHVGDADEHPSNETDEWINDLSSVVDIIESDELDPADEPSDLFDSGDVKFHIIAADVVATSSAKNARSIVIRVDLEDFEAVLTGDATFDTEEEIVIGYESQFLDVELLKIGHHGSSATSTSQGFVDFLRPKVAVVSADFHSPFEHPRKSVVERVAASTLDDAPRHFMRWGVRQSGETVLQTVANYEEAIFNTGSNGHIVVTTDGTDCKLRYGRPGRLSGEMSFTAETPGTLTDDILSSAVASIADSRLSMSFMDESMSTRERAIRSLELEQADSPESDDDSDAVDPFALDPRLRSVAPGTKSRQESTLVGAEVTVTTAAGSVSGKLLSLEENQATVLEQGLPAPTIIRGSAMIIRPVARK